MVACDGWEDSLRKADRNLRGYYKFQETGMIEGFFGYEIVDLGDFFSWNIW